MAITARLKDVLEDFKYCPECGEVREEDEYDRAYECGGCGNKFSFEEADGGNRCPECGKFGTKIADECCTDCFVELEPIKGVNLKDVDDDYMIVEGGEVK